MAIGSAVCIVHNDLTPGGHVETCPERTGSSKLVSEFQTALVIVSGVLACPCRSVVCPLQDILIFANTLLVSLISRSDFKEYAMYRR